MEVKFLRDHGEHAKGDKLEVSGYAANRLVAAGAAEAIGELPPVSSPNTGAPEAPAKAPSKLAPKADVKDEEKPKSKLKAVVSDKD